MKRPIIFDLGGVLVDWNPRHLYRKVFPEPEMEFFLGHVCTGTWNLATDAGKPFLEAIREKQREWPAYEEAILWWRTRWEEMLAGPIQGTVDLLRELKENGHPVFALSNWSAETFPIARRRFEFLDWFQDILISGDVGLVKPDPAIFRLASRRFGVPMEGTVFIDDALPNVEAARALGFEGIHFTGAAPLRRALAWSGDPGSSHRTSQPGKIQRL